MLLIIILWIFLENGECFNFNDSSGCAYPTLNIMRLLGQVYRLRLLVCYPCSFYFHAFMLIAFWERKLPLVNDNGRDKELNTNFDRILTFSLAKGSDFFLSLVVKTGLKTPAMGIAWPASLDKDCFDMLKSI